jgi:acetyltransferase-like isoleucine patch superfamily enzyme
MHFAGLGIFGRIATRLATWFVPPFYGRTYLSKMNTRGYASPIATIHHPDLRSGANVYIDDRVLIYKDKDGGPVELGEGVKLFRDTILQTGKGGSITIGSFTNIQPRCQFSAYKGSIKIGCGVDIGPNCSFFPYNHGIAPDLPIRKQPLETKGDIVVEDGAWLGTGVIVLEGVTIGKGAVVGAGSVVTKDVPDNSIAVGVPSRITKLRTYRENEFGEKDTEDATGKTARIFERHDSL